MTARHVASSAGPLLPSPSWLSLTDVLETGGTAFLGLAAYSYVSGMRQLEKQRAVILKSNSWLGMRSRRMGIGGLSLGLAYLGMYRLFA